MTNKNEIYKCELCGNVVSVLHEGQGTLVCCGQDMTLQKENTVDASKEKHVPIIEKTDDGIIVKVGSVPHPMEEKHYISLIQLVDKDNNIIIGKRLSPNDKPEAKFCCVVATDIKARIYCNLHGLWVSE